MNTKDVSQKLKLMTELNNKINQVYSITNSEIDIIKTKREYFKEWINAVNNDKRFGTWEFDVSFRTADIKDILKKHSRK